MKTNSVIKTLYGSNFLLPLLVFMFILSACSSEEGLSELNPIVFNGQIQSEITDRTWRNGDRIGVFAFKSGTILQQNNILDNNNNLPFITEGNGLFQSQVKNIYSPEDGSAMDIIAYYPFTIGLTDYTFPINILTQTDFLYSNNLTNIRSNTGSNQLNFIRPLSKLVINILPKTNDINLSQLEAVMRGAKTKANFSLATGTLAVDENSVADVSLIVSNIGTRQQRISMWVLPEAAPNDTEILFSVGNASYILKLPYVFESGKEHIYSVELDLVDTGGGGNPEPPIIVVPFAYMEIPVSMNGELPPNTVEIRHKVGNRNWLNTSLPLPGGGAIRNYTVLYDTQNRLPVWVAYPLHPIYLASGNRTDDWQFDPQLPGRYQPVLLSSWRSRTTELFDRGHVLPSADRSATQQLNATTFYFTNFVIQNRSMNQGSWENLESQVRRWSTTRPNDTIYVVSGQIMYPTPRLDAVDNNGIASNKPAYMYKALLRRNMTTNTFTTIGFKMENENNSAPHTQRVISVRQLEEETGFTFFPTLPEGIAASVKENTNMNLF
jgi:endonuclease G